MLGFGELLAHEAAFRLGWSGTKVRRHLFEELAFHFVFHDKHSPHKALKLEHIIRRYFPADDPQEQSVQA